MLAFIFPQAPERENNWAARGSTEHTGSSKWSCR